MAIISGNTNINKIYYNGYTISKIYACGGSLVWSGGTTPTGATKFQATYSDSRTYSLECNSSSYLMSTETKPSGYPISSMTSVVIGDCVNEIGTYAFESGFTLTSVTMPNTVTKINSYAFHKCSGLTSVVLPNSVTSIGTDVFAYCTSLSSVTLSNNLATIGSGTFRYCSGLTNVGLVGSGSSVEIPNSVTTISGAAFQNCSSLTSVTIPNSVTRIGDHAFDDCSGLTSVTIGTGITNIDSYITYMCPNLQSITINATVPPSIHQYAFLGGNNCPIYVPCDSVDAYKAATNWTSFTSRIQPIQGSCTETKWIGTYTGHVPNSGECNSSSVLTEAEILAAIPPQPNHWPWNCVETLEIGDCVTSIGVNDYVSYEGICNSCTYLTAVTIPNSVTTIGNSSFYGCRSLSSITIPDSVTTIGRNAFGFCKSLLNITLPSGVTYIGRAAFEGIGSNSPYNPLKITILATTPPTLETYDSSYLPFYKSTVEIYVPDGSVNDYKSAAGWSSYASKFKPISEK